MAGGLDLGGSLGRVERMGILGEMGGYLVYLVGVASMSGSTELVGYGKMEGCFFVDGYGLVVVGIKGFLFCDVAGTLVVRLLLLIRRKGTETIAYASSRLSGLL